ncbi:hypothetical protein N326_02765, partial [Eurypyga helias]
NTPGKLSTTGQGGETWTSLSDLTPSPTTIVGTPHSEIQAAEASTSQAPPFASSDKTPGMKAVKKTSDPTNPTPESQSNGHSDGDSDDSDKDKMGSPSSNKGTSLQNDAREIPLQQEVTASRDTATGNRSLKPSSYITGITSSQQDANSKASGFEST